MKKSIKTPTKIGMLLASFMLVCSIVSATTYTAVLSGNWSASATWGGTAPPFVLSTTDQVIIPLLINVTMDQNVTLNGASASLDVLGTLSASPFIKLNDISGTITGAGSINAANIIFGAAATVTATGAIIADSINDAMAALNSTAQITFYNVLDLSGVLTMDAAGILTAGANSNILISGGSIALLGGSLALTATYNVKYITSSALAGLELTGTGLGTVTIATPIADTVALLSNVIMTDSLKFTSGILKLNGFTLTTVSQITGAVAIAGNMLSSVIINTPAGLSNALNFVKGFQNVNNLTVNVGGGNSVAISSPLTVNGVLMIATGSTLNISNEALTVVGDLTGLGMMQVNALSKLAFTGITSVTGDVALSGIMLSKFTENIGAGKTLTLATALKVDTLDLMSGTLVLNGNNMSVNGDVTAAGTGLILSTSKSDITVTTTNAVTGPIMFSALGDSIHNMTVTIGNSGSVKLGTDLIIKDTLHFFSGYVDLDSNNLSIGMAGAVTGAGINAYVITSGGGDLIMDASVSKARTFQVGTVTNYLPALISLNSGSDSGTIGLSVSPKVYAQGITGVVISASQPMVDATWLFQNNIGSGINANMTLSWAASAEVNGFMHANDYISHYASMWDDIGDSMVANLAGGLYSVTRANITSMSPFAVFEQKTIPTSINEVTKANSDFIIYPNPASENLYVKNATGTTGLVNVEVYNTLGQLVSNFQSTNDLIAVPVSQLAAGTYLIRLYNDNLDMVKKFSKM
ncbi:MAG TPA: T9SS type A sorting domain-containing protein [Bacteroidia bacterium]|jgi:hypothetical protein|nr:T9SS type A sorting domain-containing protein [Bacteroidia bacterium]